MGQALSQSIDWIETNPDAVLADIWDYGVEAAARHNADVAAEQVRDGDDRWNAITEKAMRQALQAMEVQEDGTIRYNV